MRSTRRGLTLLEVLIAAAVLMLGVACGFVLLTMSHRYARETPSKELAEALTRAAMTRYWRLAPGQIEAELGLDTPIEPSRLEDPVLQASDPWTKDELERMGHRRRITFSRAAGFLSGIAMDCRTSWRGLDGQQRWAIWGIYWFAPPDLERVDDPPPAPDLPEWRKDTGHEAAALDWAADPEPLAAGLSPYAKARAAASASADRADPTGPASRAKAGSEAARRSGFEEAPAWNPGAADVSPFARRLSDPARIAEAATRRREAAFAARQRRYAKTNRGVIRDGRWAYAADRLDPAEVAGPALAALYVESHPDPLLVERLAGFPVRVAGEPVLETRELTDGEGRAWTLARTEDRLFVLSAEDRNHEGSLIARTLPDFDGTAAGLASPHRALEGLLAETGFRVDASP